jgi:hypothetical protein
MRKVTPARRVHRNACVADLAKSLAGPQFHCAASLALYQRRASCYFIWESSWCLSGTPYHLIQITRRLWLKMNTLQRMGILAGLLAASTLAPAFNALAATLSVNNASFESPITGSWVRDIADWTIDPPAGTNAIGTWRPGDKITDFSIHGNGDQAAYIRTGAFYQDVASIVAGTTYQLSIRLFDQTDRDLTTGSVGLYSFDGNTETLLAKDAFSATKVTSNGGFADLGVTYLADAGDAGSQLRIKIESTSDASGQPQASFDKVARSAVPLPAAAWLFGSAVLGFALFSTSRKV